MTEITYRAAKYIRLSFTDDKSSESDSVQNQRKMLDSFVSEHPDIEAAAEYVDDGISGILFDRKAFKKMMTAIEVGEINCVIVKDLSRFGREFSETGRYLRRILPAYGVRFIAITDNIDTLRDSSDDLVVSIKSIMNEAYCRDISIKTRSALSVKRENGDFVGALPVYGYVRSEDNKNKLVVDEYAASIVRDIYRLKLEGMSAQKIADYLNSLGILSPMEYKRSRGLPFAENCYGHKSDARWSAKTVLRILGNETYTGTLVQGRQTTRNYKVRDIVHKPEAEWIRTENAHEPIVSKLDFDLVRRIMRLDTSTSKNADAVYLFSGILICGSCGGPMTHKINRVGGKEYHYYFCPTPKRQGCPTSNMVKQQDLDGCVLESIKSHIVNVASLDALLSGGEGQRMASALAAQYRTSIDDNRAQLETIRSFKSSLYENMVNGIVSKDDYKLIRGKYNDDEERLRTATEKLTREFDDVLAGKGERIKWTENFKRFEDMQELDRRTVINLIQSIKVISKTELQITFNYQLEYDIAQHLISAESPRNQAAGCFDGEEDDKRNEANARRQASAA